MTTSMHMWIGVCLCSGGEPVADPSVLHMASIVVKMLDNYLLSERSPRVLLLREKLLVSLFLKTPHRWQDSLQAHTEAAKALI